MMYCCLWFVLTMIKLMSPVHTHCIDRRILDLNLNTTLVLTRTQFLTFNRDPQHRPTFKSLTLILILTFKFGGNLIDTISAVLYR